MLGKFIYGFAKDLPKCSRFVSKCVLRGHNGRVLHTAGTALLAKKFSDSENDYAHGILQRVAAMAAPIQAPAKFASDGQRVERSLADVNARLAVDDWQTRSAHDLVENLTSIVDYVNRNDVSMSDERFNRFVDAFASKARTFTDGELTAALNALARINEIESIHEKNYLDLWSALDDECLARVPDWNTEKLLCMADHWYPLRLVKRGKFVHKAVWKICNRLRKLSRDQLVKTVFYINLTRTPVENMIDIEVNFKQNFATFAIDDVAILCMGFFKTETPIRDATLIEQIYQITMQHTADINDISLTAILKLLRYSSRIPSAPSMNRLLTALVPEIPRLSLFSCLHLALLGSDIHLCHEASLRAVFERFIANIESLRLKDMERIAFVISHYNLSLVGQCDLQLCRLITAELPNRIPEIMQFPRCYIGLLNFLALKDFFEPELATMAFDSQFLRLAFGKNLGGAGREAISLDVYTRINRKDTYEGNSYPPKSFKVAAKLTQDYVPDPKYRVTKSDRMLLDIQRTIQQQGFRCHITHLLPHYQRPDIVLCVNGQTGKTVDVQRICPPQYSGEILTRQRLLGADETDGQMRLLAVVAGSWNCYIREQNRVTGGFAMKLKQLQLIGYETLVIPWYDWPAYSIDDMHAYLAKKLAPLLPPTGRQY